MQSCNQRFSRGIQKLSQGGQIQTHLDYIALISIIAGFVFIFMGFLFGGILVPVGVFLELVASCVGRGKK